jgi:hypothetical protein
LLRVQLALMVRAAIRLDSRPHRFGINAYSDTQKAPLCLILYGFELTVFSPTFLMGNYQAARRI